jgi:hypothetical protein
MSRGTESAIEREVRLVLEKQCADAFMQLRRGALAAVDFTLLFFDYGEEGQTGNVAFKTTLSAFEVVEAFTLLTNSWKSRLPRVGFGPLKGAKIHERATIEAIAESIKRPEGVGFALLVGRGELTSYIASGARGTGEKGEGVHAMIENDLLPRWRENVGLE